MAGKLTGPTSSKTSTASTPIPLGTEKMLCVDSQLDANSTNLSKRDENVPNIRFKQKEKEQISLKKSLNNFQSFSLCAPVFLIINSILMYTYNVTTKSARPNLGCPKARLQGLFISETKFQVENLREITN